MAGHKKGTVKYNIQMHPTIIEALTDCAALTGHPTGNALATELIQYGLDYLNGDDNAIPPALEELRSALTDPDAPAPSSTTSTRRPGSRPKSGGSGGSSAGNPGSNNIAATLAEHTRQIAELRKAMQAAGGKAGRGKKR